MLRLKLNSAKYFAAALFSVSLYLVGCAADIPRTAPAFEKAPAAQDGYATLYIFRPWSGDDASGVWPVTFLNDTKTADVKVFSYTYVYLRPGSYHVRTERSGLLSGLGNTPFDFTISSTGSYYLEFGSPGQSTTLGVGGAFVTIGGSALEWHLVSEQVAMGVLPKMRYLTPYVQNLDH